jgi:hypothetical protein
MSLKMQFAAMFIPLLELQAELPLPPYSAAANL